MKRYTTNKDWNVVIKRLIRNGWIYQRGGKHGRLVPPNGARTVTVSNSPSDRRSLKNFLCLVKQIVRAD